MSRRHTASIRDNVYAELLEYGKFGESFDNLLNRLMDNMDTKSKK